MSQANVINPFVICVALLILSGCSTVAHLDQLLTLQELSKNGDQKEAYIKERNDKLKSLIAAVDNNTIQQYADAQQILQEFGDPVFVKKKPAGGEWVERWVYRDAKKLNTMEKVYLYFDSTLKLVRSEHIKDPKASEAPQEKSHLTVTQ